jgi:ParB family chromosome partitioning protein
VSEKKNMRRALGRGLTSLIPLDSEEKGSDHNVEFIDITALRTNPFQPRTEFNQEEIAGLAASIEAQGLLQPIAVRKKGETYEIISGERRYRAVKHLGRDRIAAIVLPKISDREMLEMALVENLQREDLNDIEKGIAYQRLLLDCGISHEELSKRVGKSRSLVTNTIRLLKLPKELQNLVRQGKLSGGHARALLGVDGEPRQISLAQRIVSEGISVREIEKLANDAKPTHAIKKKKPAPQLNDPNILHLIEQLQYRLGTAVAVKPTTPKGGGTVEIYYHGIDDLGRILELLK